jgi:hypothetical protein
MPTPAEIKKAIVAAGFEVYRTRGGVVHIADRVRENLLMDGGVFIDTAAREGLAVGFVVRAQRSDFPGESGDRLFERARGLGVAAADRGYREVEAAERVVKDPGDDERTIEVFHEVRFEKPVADADAAIAEIRFALALEKAASR